MIAKMIVNRTIDWFQIKDLELDSCVLAIELLEKLSTRPIAGLKYDRISLSSILLHRRSAETIDIVDDVIVILISRELIELEEIKYGERKIKISEKGINAINHYKELMSDEN